MEVEKRCRLCLSYDTIDEPIFNPRDDGIPFSTKIMICTAIMVDPDDNYSKYICSNCADMLDLFHHFRNSCFKTLVSLQSSVNGLTDETILEDGKIEMNTEYTHCSQSKGTYNSENVKENYQPSTLAQNNTEYELGIEKVVSEEVVFDEQDFDRSRERQFQVGCYETFLDGIGEDPERDGLSLMRRFRCITCKKVFSSLDELDSHWEDCLENINHNEIPTDFVDGEEVEDTVNQEDEENEEEVESDVHKNPDSKTFICQTCGQVFKQLWLLTRHNQVKHIGIKPYSCPKCPRKFYDKYELKYHQRLHEDMADFTCNICGHRFARRSGLKTHMRSHTGEKPFKCRSCNKSFAHLNSLITHERVHTGERPYSCKFCPRTFAQYSTAKSHEGMHQGGQRLFQCEVCDRMYKSERELNSHFLSHGVLDHRCSPCNRGFRKLSELRKHNERFHFEKKSFACMHCPKSYVTSRELENHIKSHTGELPFLCLLCSKRYRLKSTLRKHMDKHHKIIPSTSPLESNSISLDIF